MLSLSQKCIYGVHAVYGLALKGEKGTSVISEIARDHKIPEDYLRQVLIVLKRAGIVKSSRGTNGGYTIARSADSITIRDIIESIEGEITLTTSMPDDRVLESFWKKSNIKFREIFDTNIGDLIKEKIKMHKVFDYSI